MVEHYTARPSYKLLSDAMEIRFTQCSRYELVRADDHAYTSAPGRRQHTTNLFDDLRGAIADKDVSLRLQEPLESSSIRMECVPVGISDTFQPDEENEGTVVGTTGEERLPEDTVDPTQVFISQTDHHDLFVSPYK